MQSKEKFLEIVSNRLNNSLDKIFYTLQLDRPETSFFFFSFRK